MIVLASPKKQEKPYGNYFLYFEADDEQPQEDTGYEPKANTKVIRVRPNSGNRKDFSKFINDEDDEGEDVADDQPVDDTAGADTGETPPEDINNEEQPAEDVPQDPTPSVTGDDTNNTDDVNFGPDIDTGEDIGVDDGMNPEGDVPPEEGETPPEEDGEAIDGPDVDTGEDIGVDDAGEGEVPPEGEEAPDQPKGPGLEYDSTRKYNLFKEFVNLSISIDNYISKLEDNMSDNIIQNRCIKIALDKLYEIKDLCTDYMLINFEANSYTKSILFYQMMTAAIQKVFKLLSKGNEYAAASVEKK